MQRFTARYRYSAILLKQLVKSDFKLRYQGSVLGYAWSLLRPLFLFLILYIVFAKFLRIGDSIPHYPLYLLLGVVLWSYFIEVTTGSVSAIVGKGDLIRKINFPKYVIVLSSCASAFINLILNFLVIAVFMIITGVDMDFRALLAIPLIFQLTIFALGVAFFLSTAFVRYRDVGYIWEVVTQAAFYATPIIYPLTLVPEVAQKFLLLNPVAQIIQDMRYVLVTPETITLHKLYGGFIVWSIPVSVTVVTVCVAALYFRRRSKHFAEEV